MSANSTLVTRLNIRIVVAAGAFALCYAGVIWTIVGIWSNHPLYSYGFVVPLISGYVLFTKWGELRGRRPSPDYLLGVSATVLGLSVLVAGRLGSILAAQQFSLVLTLAGLVLLLFGRQTLSIAAFPLLYLMVGVPIWDRVIQGLQAPSQVLSGRIALTMLQAVGVPALRDGTTLVLPTVTLDILRACSGVNQLIAVFALTVPAAYLWLVGMMRRAALVAFAISVAYLSNGFRIAMVGFLDYRHLAGGDIQWLHLFEGLATSVLGYSLIFLCLSFLARVKPHTKEVVRPSVSAAQPRALELSSARQAWLEAGALALIVLVGVFMTTYRAVGVELSQELRTLPTQLGSWAADSSRPISSGYRLGLADDELDRTYRTASGDRLRLYIGYQRYEEQGKELAGFESWELANAASPIEITFGSESVRLNEVAQTGATRKGTLFWFDVSGRTVTSWYFAKACTIWNALSRGRTNGAIVLVEWDAPVQADFEVSRRGAIAFVGLLRPYLAHYIPS